MLFRLARLVLPLALMLAASLSAQAEERILSFDSHVQVARDGTLTVTETIRVRAEGRQIRRGIFRDIPLRIEQADGTTVRAGFHLVSVERGGKAEPYSVDSGHDGVRIYIGDENVFLRDGAYTYTITYETNRQVRFFDDHDEVFWNATGNEWAFPIDAASARVVLPEGVRALESNAFTGYYGDTGKDVRIVTQDGGRRVSFTATRPLRPKEGLSVAVSMPPGTISPPSAEQQVSWFFADHRVEILSGIGLVLVIVYYVFAWWTVGRDPRPGVIFPRFEAPEGLSPALCAYVADKGFGSGGWRALSAACLNLAVKRRLDFSDLDDDLTISRPTGDHTGTSDLPRGEKAIIRWMNRRDEPLTLNKDNGKSIQSLGKAFRSAIEGENRERYFKRNRIWMVPGIALSVVTIFALLAFGNMSDNQIAAMIPLFIVSMAVAVFSVHFGKAVQRSRGVVFRVLIALVFFLLTGAGQIVGAAVLMAELGETPVLPLIALTLLSVNVFFGWILGAPTALGRQALDEIEGLRMYLDVAEKERMNMEGAPRMTPSHFETLLPYAVALKVEKPWSEAFQSWLATAEGAAIAASYHPGFYHGAHFDRSDIAGSFADTMGGGMADGFSSSLPAPKSSGSGFSSSGGGGFSGGGGGGGGGGGW
ncbi:MAG: hypothetical protein CMN87_06325 [Stappia sp.]|uniref:DUF2207 domain-containing protein n=1 Tax=Stappia sp. TaxID=1870903 RepID=UPI000C61C6A8|nr:DUF2207 domain-containing protein [Stappia sp.]MAA97980.1 hypothetical protein [Stappia sp.]MBM19606.1 hypothetical protein [Stappia sp.]